MNETPEPGSRTIILEVRDVDVCSVHGGDRMADAPGKCELWDSDPYALHRCDFLN